MRTMGLTIGMGSGWRELAERSAVRMATATGLECRVMSSCGLLPAGWSPSWAKAWAFDMVPQDVDRLLIFDADIFAVGPWRDWDVEGPLAVVRHVATRPVQTEMALYGLQEYWNAGLFVIRRPVADALRMVATYGPRYGAWLEQTAINHVFTYCEKEWMPAGCNYLIAPPPRGQSRDVAVGAALGAVEAGATCLHFSGYGGDAGAVAGVFDEMEGLL
jgi:hypothetical protein